MPHKIISRLKNIWKTSKTQLYDQDGLKSVHNHDFMLNSNFKNAYARGIKAASVDYEWHWRVHIGLWGAAVAAKLPGDFIECGVNTGFMSSSILNSLPWSELNKTFYLLDTFNGLDEKYLSKKEKEEGASLRNRKALKDGFYVSSMEKVKHNFSEWENIRLIQGSIPETLTQVNTPKVAFLHIDLNCSIPEIKALEYFWEKLTPGAIVLLDDYGYIGYHNQKIAMDNLAKTKGFNIASLPTGQGLIVKT